MSPRLLAFLRRLHRQPAQPDDAQLCAAIRQARAERRVGTLGQRVAACERLRQLENEMVNRYEDELWGCSHG